MKRFYFMSGLIAMTVTITMLLGFLFGIRAYVVLSGSMEPTISTGSLCFVDIGAEYDEIKERDVIAYEKKNGMLVTHRVIARTADGLVTKGDANAQTDGISVTIQNFRGKTLFSIPYLGYLIFRIRRSFGWILVIGIAIYLMNNQWK